MVINMTGLDVFSKSLRPCASAVSSFSIGRVKPLMLALTKNRLITSIKSLQAEAYLEKYLRTV